MLDSPEETIDNLIRLYEEGKIISILNNSDELIAKYPNNATIHNLIGAGFSQFNEIEKSLYHLQKAIQLEPKNHLILNNLGNVYIDINEYQKVYDKAKKAGKSENDSIKKMMEAKRKEAENILLGDILRVLDNKKKNNIEITTYFRVVNKRA